MFTQEQKDRKVKAQETLVSEAQGRVTRYTELKTKAEAELEHAKKGLDWIKTAPVNAEPASSNGQHADTAAE